MTDKKLASQGNNFGKTKIMAKSSHFGKICATRFSGQIDMDKLTVYPHLFITRNLLKCCNLRAFHGVKSVLKILVSVKDFTFYNPVQVSVVKCSMFN